MANHPRASSIALNLGYAMIALLFFRSWKAALSTCLIGQL
jgi:hypothetical protein